VYKLNLVGEYEGKSLLGRSKHICEDNIKVYPKDIGWQDAEWIILLRGTGIGRLLWKM